MLKIYGAALSSPANKVRFVVNYLGVKHEYVPVNLRQGEQKKPEFIKVNPGGRVPAMDDNGFMLFESGAIIKYLADRENSSIYPKALKERAIVDQWIDFINLHVLLGVSKVTYNRLFAKIRGEEVDERSIKDGLNFISRNLPVVDQAIGNNKFFLGNNISLVDFTLVAALDPVEAIDVDISAYKNVSRLRDSLKKMDFYTKCHSDYRAALEAVSKKS